jgi:arylsulfatase A-like enzyme
VVLAATVAFLAAGVSTSALGAERLPNIVLILADDMGYGDVGAFNPESKIATPNIDGLAWQGIRLTDAHSAPLCIPTRYGLLTGRYLFRTNRDMMRDALIEPGRPTLASLLKEAGYTTAMVGKWHLGFADLGVHPAPLDYAKPLRGGPVDHGFDTYFGIPASLDVAPYFFIENDRAVEAATGTTEEHHSPGWRSIQGEFWRGGRIAPDFKHEEVLPRLTDRAVHYLESRAGSRQPFFFYFALPAPHPPWVPLERFRGKSGAGMYGDYVMEVDADVGRVLAALQKAGKANDTLVIITSDNGPTWYEADVRKYGHSAAGGWRGMKADVWEGGHRMPFVARWPGKIAAGASSTQLVSLTDMVATFAHLTGQTLSHGAGEDSLSVLPILLGRTSKPIRDTIIHEGGPGELAIRQGNWKLIPWLSDMSMFEGFGYGPSSEFTPPAKEVPRPGGPQAQLYNLAEDPGERHNVYTEHPEIVQRLAELLQRYRREGRSRPN